MQWLYNIFAGVFQWVDGFIGNYAWSIMVLTVLLRLVMLPVDYRQKVTMRRQKALQPKIEALQKKYKNDKDKLGQKQMELYKAEKINPLSGCLPSLLTIPIFFAFFGALRMIEANQMAHLFTAMQNINPGDTQAMDGLVQGWLWIQNIWRPDAFTLTNLTVSNIIPQLNASQFASFVKQGADFAALANSGVTVETFNEVMLPLHDYFAGIRMGWNGFFILPLLAGGTSLLHSKMMFQSQPQTPVADGQKNPLSGKFMQYLFPIMSLYFCASSSAVFAIYWFTSNVIAILSYIAMEKYLARKDARNASPEMAVQ